MKTNTCYRLGILAMCIMPIYMIVGLTYASALFYSAPDISGDEIEWLQLLFPVLGLVVVPIAGLVLYVRKKALGWILCCGYSIVVFAGTVISYLVLWRVGLSLEENTSGLLIQAAIHGILLASVVGLFLSRQVRSVFSGSGQARLSDAILTAVVTAILIGILIFLPRVLNSVKYVIVLMTTILFALRWLINQSGKS